MILDATKPLPPDLPLESLSLLTPPAEAREWVEELKAIAKKY
jgi:hypothetical protein